MNYRSMTDELKKIANAEVTSDQALAAVERLRQLDRERPSPSQLARGALAGSVAGTAAMAARSLVDGKMVGGVRRAMTQPTLGGKLKSMGLDALQNTGAVTAGSAVSGALLPMVSRKLDSTAEKAKLEQYLGTNQRGRARTHLAKTLGVG